MKIVLPMMCCFTLLSNIALAENEWPTGSAMHSGGLAVHEAEMYEKKTSKLMDEIYTMLDNDYYVQAIKEQIKAWEIYKSSTCHVVGVATGAGGSWPSTYAVRCERGLSYERYFATKNALRCMKRAESNPYQLRTDKINCLIQTLNIKVF